MKIAVWIDSNYCPTNGGSFFYDNRLIQAIDNFHFSSELDICFVTSSSVKTESLSRELIRLSYTPHITSIEKIKRKIPLLRKRTRIEIQKRIERERNAHFIDTLKKNGIRIIYYINQFPEIINNFPFIITHWDIGHRSSYAFPEFSIVENYKARETYYKDILPRALMIFVESLSGQTELLTYTHINKERTRVVPLFPGECTSLKLSIQEQEEILDHYQLLSNKYFFYPAQFWPEKNHFTILKAFAHFLQSHPDYKLIFTGDPKENEYGTFLYNKKIVHQLAIEKNVIFGGFVPISHIYTLYKNACSLIMATFVGPTNMPPLEAMELGCPVICSDLPGHREELGDAAIYINPSSEEDISQAMETMIKQREDYVKKINEQREKSVFRLENALEAINTHLHEAVSIRECWE